MINGHLIYTTINHKILWHDTQPQQMHKPVVKLATVHQLHTISSNHVMEITIKVQALAFHA
jgi:hypothetical protein